MLWEEDIGHVLMIFSLNSYSFFVYAAQIIVIWVGGEMCELGAQVGLTANSVNNMLFKSIIPAAQMATSR